MHHEAEVEFEEQPPAGQRVREQCPAISLEITSPKEAECKAWDFYSLTPVQVTISNNKMTSILKLARKALGVLLDNSKLPIVFAAVSIAAPFLVVLILITDTIY